MSEVKTDYYVSVKESNQKLHTNRRLMPCHFLCFVSKAEKWTDKVDVMITKTLITSAFLML